MSKILKLLAAFVFLVLFGGFLMLSISHAASTVAYPTAAKDSDYDGLTDQAELQIYKTDPNKADTDGDAYLDGAEMIAGSDPLDPNSPASSISTNNSTGSAGTLWPWYVSRASGIVSYIILFLLLVSGMGIKTSLSFKFLSPTFAWLNHRYLGIALTVSIATHVVSLLLDKFMNFSFLDVFIPFYSSFKPIFLSLGIAGLYLLLVVITTSLYYINKYHKSWRLLHYLTFPLFVILFIHGYFIGTDSSTILMHSAYLLTGTIVGVLVLYRLYFYYKQQ